MANIKELETTWAKAGRPRTVEGLIDVLKQTNLSDEQVQQVFQMSGIQMPIPEPIEEPKEEVPEISDEEVEQHLTEPEPEVVEEPALDIPVGFVITSKTGDEFTWKGAQWVSKGKIVPKKYRHKLDAAAQIAYKKKLKADQDAADAKQAEIDSKYEFDGEEEKPAQAAPKSRSPSPELVKIAKQLKSSPQHAKIAELLAMNDPVADQAINLILSGQADRVLADLKQNKDS